MQIYQEQTEINPINTLIQHDSRSKKYNFINSQDIINQIVGNGFEHITTSFANTRKASKKGFQKHIMIFEHPKFLVDEGNKLQLLVTNAHDGSSSLKFNLGVFRTVCANGLVVGDSFHEVRILHSGINRSIYTTVLDDILKQSGNYVEMIRKMRSIQLTSKQMVELKDVAAKLRFRDIGKLKEVSSFQFLDFKRNEDSGTDLWTVFNVVQEKMIRGGIKYTYTKDEIRDNKVISITKNSTTRAIKNFKQVEQLNKQLWNIAEKLAA